ncbi:MAG: helix-turn-helix domain-containing protein [Lyngbya sp.]|nr:helix-turn-helix domain-containing protein [Lyngbya sp.]
MQAPQEQPKKEHCPAETTLAMISGRWKLLIWRELFSGVKRFNELHRSLTGITQKMLTQHLREMEADGLVHRKVYAEIPPKVEYSLTEKGKSLHPLIEQMHAWGIEFTVTSHPKGDW